MKCKNCGAELLDTDRFCINCGTLVDVKIENCPFCGEKLREGEKFCHRCGAEIPVPGETPKEVPAGTYPNALNTMEIGALTDAVIAAAQREINNDESRKEAPANSSAAPENVPMKPAGEKSKAAPLSKKKSVEKYSGTPKDKYQEDTAGEYPEDYVESYPEDYPENYPEKRVNPARQAPKRAPQKKDIPETQRTVRRNQKPSRPAYKENTDVAENTLNIAIIAGGILILIMLGVVLFMYAKNEGLIPRSGPPQEMAGEEEQKKDKKPEKPGEAGNEETDSSEAEENAEETELGKVRVTAGSLNIRDGASTSGTQVIGKAKKGDEYPYLEIEGEWYYIDAGSDVKGYVHQDYVEVIDE